MVPRATWFLAKTLRDFLENKMGRRKAKEPSNLGSSERTVWRSIAYVHSYPIISYPSRER